MYPILFSYGSLTLYSYGLMLALAFLSGIAWAVYMGKKEGLKEELVLDLSLFSLIASIIGARVVYVIFFWPSFKNNVWEIFMIWHGGLVFYGGVLFAILTLAFMIHRKKLPVLKLLDIAAPTTAIGYAIGRIGCFLNGCCYGVVCDLPWGVHFPHLSGLRHPTQLYASFAGLFIFLSLVILWKRRSFEGQLLLTGLILYSVYRFLIEFIRTSPVSLYGLTQAQLASILIFLAALIMYGILYFRSRKA